MKLAHTIVCGAIAAVCPPLASARGVTPYLPLNLSPAIERQIERVLILAGKPVMRRPIAAAVVLDALPSACEQDRAACDQVRRYLQTYMRTLGLTSLDVQLAASTGDSNAVLPNRHGESVDSPWRAVASAYYQPNDYVIVNAGGVAYDGNATPTGSFLSLGFNFAQLDIGYRDHWLSPLGDSSTLISTEAPTMPSITLSNYEPISPLGISYEVFAAEMSRQDGILIDDDVTSGRPRLAGLHLSMEPVVGYGVSVNRIAQYGGGARNGNALSDFTRALFETGNILGTDRGATNRIASLASSIQFPGRVPFAVNLEYAGEDNTYEGRHRLGLTNFSASIDFPVLWRDLDATFAFSEWQNGWYVHHLYPLGLINEDRILGHWFADHRDRRDALGGDSQMVRVGWHLSSGDYLQGTYRRLQMDERWDFSNPSRAYESLHLLGLAYFTSWQEHPIRVELDVGRDVYGDSFGRISAAFDFARTAQRSGRVASEVVENTNTEVFVDVGLQYSRVREFLLLQFKQRDTTSFETNYHIGFGARRRVSQRNDLGVRLELDRVHGFDLVSVRALDYRFRWGQNIALGASFGVGRYDIELPAWGYYLGAGVQYRNLFPDWDLTLDYRHYDKMTRDKGLPSDPESNPGLPRRVIDVHGLGLFISKRW